MLLMMMGVCTRNMSSYEYTNKITLLHQVGISIYFTQKECSVRILRIKQSKNCLTLSFKTSKTTHQMKQRHIPDNLDHFPK